MSLPRSSAATALQFTFYSGFVCFCFVILASRVQWGEKHRDGGVGGGEGRGWGLSFPRRTTYSISPLQSNPETQLRHRFVRQEMLPTERPSPVVKHASKYSETNMAGMKINTKYPRTCRLLALGLASCAVAGKELRHLRGGTFFNFNAPVMMHSTSPRPMTLSGALVSHLSTHRAYAVFIFQEREVSNPFPVRGKIKPPK